MIAWNDRRKARKAASNTMKTQLGMMAKTGAIKKLDAPSKDPYEAASEKRDNKSERKEVMDSAYRIRSEYNYKAENAGSDKRMSRRESVDKAAYGNDLKRKQAGK